MAYPKWVSPSRLNYLLSVFLKSGGFCVFGNKPCQGSWQEKGIWACAYGRQCPEPTEGLCRFRPEDGKPHLRCRVVHANIRRWHCAYGAYPCYSAKLRIGELGNRLLEGENYYNQFESTLIKEWRADGKAQDTADWREEQKRLHSLAERRYPIRGQFNNISRDIYFANQPLFYLLGLGVSGLTYKPFADVRLASSFVHIFVDLGDTLKRVSKSKRRKAIRYGNALPQEVQREVENICRVAVKHYLDY